MLFCLLGLSYGNDWSTMTADDGAIKMSFIKTIPADFSDFTITFDGDIDIECDKSNKSWKRNGIYYLYIPKGTENISFTIKNAENIKSLNFDAPRNNYTKLSELELSGLSNVKSLSLNLNAISWPVSVPEGCVVTYGSQEPVNFDLDDGNYVNLGDYNSRNGWSVRWCYQQNNSFVDVPSSLYELKDDGRYFFKENLDLKVTVLLSHTSGLELQSNFITVNKGLEKIIRMHTDGSGTSDEIGFGSSATNYTLLLECLGEIGKTSTLDGKIKNKLLSGYKGDVDINTNNPGLIKTLVLNNLGIDNIEFIQSLSGLTSIELRNNSLLLSAVPEELNQTEFVYLENQKIILPVSSNQYEFDLSAEVKKGGIVEWQDEYGNVISSDKYTVTDGVYHFTQSIGKVRLKLTSTKFKNYTAFSNYIEIDYASVPLMQFSWDTQQEPVVIRVTSEENATVKIEYDGKNETVSVPKGVTTPIRLPKLTGTVTLGTSNNAYISDVDLSDIGIETLRLTDEATGLKKLNLSGNHFTPFVLPQNVPVTTEIIWGKMPIVDITDCVVGPNRIDLYKYKDYDISWYTVGDTPINKDNYSEVVNYYTFTNVGDAYARLTHRTFKNLYFTTSVIDISDIFSTLVCFNRTDNNSLQLSGILAGKTRIIINNDTIQKQQGYFNITLDDTSAIDSDFQNVIKINFPGNLTELGLSNQGINKISFNDQIEMPAKIDLSYNALTFETFPLIEGSEINLDHQQPIELEVNGETGEIKLPGFAKDCEVRLLTKTGLPVSRDIYKTEEDNSTLWLLSSVINATVEFGSHSLFPNVILLSKPITFISTTSHKDVSLSREYTLSANSITLSHNVNGIVYAIDGHIEGRLAPGETKMFRPGIYVLKLSDGTVQKINLH